MAEEVESTVINIADIDDFEFVEFFREFPCLYNVKLTQYKNRNAKNKAYEELAKKFKCSVGKYS